MTNNLAHYENSQLTAIKGFITLAPDREEGPVKLISCVFPVYVGEQGHCWHFLANAFIIEQKAMPKTDSCHEEPVGQQPCVLGPML